MTFKELAFMREDDLERIFLSAPAPDAGALAGSEFRGWNVPWFTRLLGIQKFIKGFFAAADGGGVEGYNIPVRQDGFADAWTRLPDPDAPKRFGFYRVVRDARRPEALLLDYGASARNPWYRPERVLRDYLVQPDPARPDLLIGKAYLALGVRVPSNFFILERLKGTEWKPR